jgi:hypothetical protein
MISLVEQPASERQMEKLIDIFCHAIRITDPLSIKIAVGIIGGGLPLIFIVAALTKLGELVAKQREITAPNTPGPNLVPDEPDRSKESASRRSRSTQTKQPVSKSVPQRVDVMGMVHLPPSAPTTSRPVRRISGHSRRKRSCLLYPRKRTCAVQLRMSAKGQ